MNTLLKTTLLTLLLALGLAGSASAQNRIGTVDLRKLFDGFWKTRQADTALKGSAADLDKEHKGLMESFAKGEDEYKKLLSAANDLTYSIEEREKRKKLAEDKLVELNTLRTNIKQFEDQAKESLNTQRLRMRENVLKEIKDAIAIVARGETYDLVLDTSADSRNETPMVVFTTGASDLTEKVLAKLNVDAPKDLPTPDEKKDEKKGGSK
jgi:Skp family chaperone for outer membrane proteins